MVFAKLNCFSKTRLSWTLLFAFVIFFELCALFFEHWMKLEPCVMCIYERVAMLSIGIAALIGLISPKTGLLRWIGLLGWIAGSYKGLLLSMEHVQYQLHPSPFNTCDIFVNFPAWAPLNHWIPWMFEAYGECSDIVWQFLTLSMPQWLIVIFAANLAIAALFILTQFTRTNNRA